MRQLKKSKRPVVLTVKGKAAAIVQDAAAYQHLLDIAARGGRKQPAREFFAEFEARHGILRQYHPTPRA